MHSDFCSYYCAARKNMIPSLVYKKPPNLSAEDCIFLICPEWWHVLLTVTVLFKFVHASMALLLKGKYLKYFEFEALLWITEVFNEIAGL